MVCGTLMAKSSRGWQLDGASRNSGIGLNVRRSTAMVAAAGSPRWLARPSARSCALANAEFNYQILKIADRDHPLPITARRRPQTPYASRWDFRRDTADHSARPFVRGIWLRTGRFAQSQRNR